MTTDPRIHRRRVEVARAAGRRRLHRLIVLAVLLALAGTGLALLHSPLFSVRQVRVVGAPGVPRAEVLAAAGLSTHPPLVDVDTAAVASRVGALPEVATVAVHEQWPSAVEIVLTERTPAAVAAAPAGGFALLDAGGHVLAEEAARPAGLTLVDLPVPPGAPGTRVGAAALPLIAAAAAVPSGLAPQVRSVGYDASGAIVLQLAGRLVAVLGAPTQLPQKLQALGVVLAQAPTSGIATIDLSVPTAPVLTPATATAAQSHLGG